MFIRDGEERTKEIEKPRKTASISTNSIPPAIVHWMASCPQSSLENNFNAFGANQASGHPNLGCKKTCLELHSRSFCDVPGLQTKFVLSNGSLEILVAPILLKTYFQGNCAQPGLGRPKPWLQQNMPRIAFYIVLRRSRAPSEICSFK